LELAPRFLRPVLKPIAWLVDALADPARRERTALFVLAAYAMIWTLYGVLSKAIQDVQIDTAELVAWSHHPALGYAKHPPFAAWLMHAWFTLFPIRGWSCYLLAMVCGARAVDRPAPVRALSRFQQTHRRAGLSHAGAVLQFSRLALRP
jgi:hypothetical protein